ncbi:MAG: class I SAM-dependent methyltransferase [Alphaproteobacteria bacterium]
MKCSICGGNLILVDRYLNLPRVSSDCKPFRSGGSLAYCESCLTVSKPLTNRLRDEIKSIYENYEMYLISDGIEQKIFSEEGISKTRSELIINYLMDKIKMDSVGRLIDIGCGDGPTLSCFSKYFPSWDLYGLEISNRNFDKLSKISNFKNLFLEFPANGINFNIVTMIHTLEHISNPFEFLNNSVNLLDQHGLLLIQVPNILRSPFDIIIADHLNHFTPKQLAKLVGDSGCEILYISTDICPKEITIIARKKTVDSSILKNMNINGSFVEEYDIVANIEWLNKIISQTKEITNRHNCELGIFGTTIGAAWMVNVLNNQVKFFIDEDENKIGKKLFGIPIKHPSEIKKGEAIYLPMKPSTAKAITSRLFSNDKIEYFYPDAL